ncbi:Phosphoglycerate mutase [Leptospira biflexa serovar Patoc strain 'Patoc 1 (Ames)']|uniref:Putative phosphoglycerate/bisphosphoglycerate mutase n=1 Tax=Leptospira biflexa serovar Patoc (strain Patoc 1 / ATCC 23582 / Paris) TaxID=456481 RepID=B0SNZ6_LEPBP|nr:histidine phosphatase family protein [Leptospira biflexa]ABZ95315.1 Phosphoglycerate mutase [Leptospira biflexa serovar Patoc strain 'Patoc 1 (Ames)']ABZ99008.1 Putative phosphoglycerate/bisphosphoglycerate mutase [Leptospira biflexa serovar Patoc strain 'Patoc 1 (Paris)']
MDLYLIRHPETIAPKGTCYGRTDFPLKYPVEDTAETTFAHLPPNFDHLVVSPAPRAVKLANALLSKYNPNENAYHTQLNRDERLLEMDFGDWDGKLWEEIPRKDTIPWMKDFVNARTPNGEAFTDLIKRVDQFLDDWKTHGALRENWEKTNKQKLNVMIVVCHSGPIRAILCRLQGIPHEEAFKSPVDFGSVHKLEIT